MLTRDYYEKNRQYGNRYATDVQTANTSADRSYKGEMDRQARFIEENQLLFKPDWELFVKQFKDHSDDADKGWRGEYFGKTRLHMAIYRLPRFEEEVALTTWHRERKGPRFFRCYEWRAADGTLLIEGVMQFALVSVTDHRLLRGDEFMRLAPLPDAPRGVACVDPSRFGVGDLAPRGTYWVRRSDLDRNGHMNNTHYADLLCDFLPAGTEGCDPKDVQIHFAGECRLGDELILSASNNDGVAVVVGDTERGRAFAAQVRFRDGE